MIKKAGYSGSRKGKHFAVFSFSLDSAHLFYQWNKISIQLDPSSRKIELRVNGKSVGMANILMPGGCFKIPVGSQ